MAAVQEINDLEGAPQLISTDNFEASSSEQVIGITSTGSYPDTPTSTNSTRRIRVSSAGSSPTLQNFTQNADVYHEYEREVEDLPLHSPAEEINSQEKPLTPIAGLLFLCLRGLLKVPGWMDAPLKFIQGIHWQILEEIGHGAFGTCYRAIATEDAAQMCVKRIPIKPEECVEDMLRREVGLVANISHDNIIRYYGVTFEQSQRLINIFMEWMPGGSLENCIQWYKEGHKPMGKTAVISFARQMMRGLSYLHRHRIVHGDLSAKNILLDSTGRHLRIADFGTALRYYDDIIFASACEGDKVAAGRIICEMLSISPRSAYDPNTFYREFDSQGFSKSFAEFVRCCIVKPYTPTDMLLSKIENDT